MLRRFAFSPRAIATLDLRSLAAFRIALGLIVVIDAIRRMHSVTALYTDDGVFPRWLLGGIREYQWSILKVWDAPAVAWGIFIALVVFGALLIVGVGTRIVVVIVWILVTSFQSRNPFTLSGADTLIHVILFWSMFLPLGDRWSYDAWRSRRHERANVSMVTSLGALGFTLQVACVYLFTALLKDGSTWRWDGTALFYATGVVDMHKPFGKWIHGYPGLLEPLTHASLIFEFLLPLLIILPILNGWGRTFAVFATIVFHAGIFAVMDVGLFPFISGVVMLPFLAPSFWEWVGRKVPFVRNRDDVSRSQLANPFLDALAAVCIALLLTVNVATVTSLALPVEVRAIAAMSTLDQSWTMFAPNPTGTGQWIVFAGTNGRGEVDDYIGTLQAADVDSVRPLGFEQPEFLVDSYFRDKYWRKHFELLERDGTDAEREQSARYVCRTWNAAHDGADRLIIVSLVLVGVRTLPDGGWDDPNIEQLGSWTC